MSEPATRTQFADYCKRRLGHPVIEINVDDDQIDDRIDDVLEFYQDYHFDGTERLYLKHKLTPEDRERKYIFIPEKIIGVLGILDFDNSSSSVNMFDLRYQLRLHDLYDFTSVSYVSYEITMQHLRTLNLLFSGTPQTRFHRHRNRLYLDVNWSQELLADSYIIIECYGKINPDRVNFDGTISTTAGNNYVTAAGASFDRTFAQDDEFIVQTGAGEVSTRVVAVLSSNTMNTTTTWSSTEAGLSSWIPGNTEVWNDRILKDLGTAYIKRQWGNNLKKFGGIQMPGGILLNGQIIYDEAVAEIEKMRSEFISWNTLDSNFLMG